MLLALQVGRLGLSLLLKVSNRGHLDVVCNGSKRSSAALTDGRRASRWSCGGGDGGVGVGA